MMREIKFRAWDRNLKKMYVSCETRTMLIPEIGVAFLFFKSIGTGALSPDITKLILMQYTGLKDKNGRDIYEGDVITAKFIDAGRVFMALPGWAVSYWTHDYRVFSGEDMKPVPYEDTYPLYKIHFDCEIIGNIYENPELMEGG